MEKIKDFLYEKSDIFFASIVVVLVTTVVLYNLNGWLVIDGEASRYHEIPVTNEDGKKPTDNALVANPEEDKEKKEENEKSESEKKTEKKESTEQQKSENKAEQKNKEAEEKAKQEKAEAEKKAQEQKKNEQKTQEQKKQEQKKPEQKKQEQKTSNRTITIASGSTAKSIANSLKSQGIISDTNAFLNKLASSGKETKLRAGTFTIPEGSSADQIISILTK
ncbi:MAG: endolytic transglycosylase MltG [Peptostreptococcaceae bacterium]|nr:endolytic transglycosylase MltG [Peptostreptococcaceae bacterium]